MEETKWEGIQNEHGNIFYLQACIYDLIHNVTCICIYIYVISSSQQPSGDVHDKIISPSASKKKKYLKCNGEDASVILLMNKWSAEEERMPELLCCAAPPQKKQ